MRCKIAPGQYAPASNFPRRKQDPATCIMGGLVTARTSMAQHEKDILEVRNFLYCNPGASVRTVAMCCNMGEHQADLCIRKAKEMGD